MTDAESLRAEALREETIRQFVARNEYMLDGDLDCDCRHCDEYRADPGGRG